MGEFRSRRTRHFETHVVLTLFHKVNLSAEAEWKQLIGSPRVIIRKGLLELDRVFLTDTTVFPFCAIFVLFAFRFALPIATGNTEQCLSPSKAKRAKEERCRSSDWFLVLLPSSKAASALSKDMFSGSPIVEAHTATQTEVKDTTLPHHSEGGLANTTMNKSLSSPRRVIFPSLYSITPLSPRPASSPVLDSIPESPNGLPQQVDILPLEDDEAARVKDQLQHMLTLSPLVLPTEAREHSVMPVPATKPNNTPGHDSNNNNSSRVPTSICLSPPQLHKNRRSLPNSSPDIALDIDDETDSPIPPEIPLPPRPQRGSRSTITPPLVPMFRKVSSLDADAFSHPKVPCKFPKKPLRSILRSRSCPSPSLSAQLHEVEKISSVESDIPSLAASIESTASLDETASEDCFTKLSPRRKTVSEPSLLLNASSNNRISFDPHIWVREFERSETERQSIWYTPQELTTFKVQALNRIIAYDGGELIPTGTGRMIHHNNNNKKALFSHAALQVESSSATATTRTTPPADDLFRMAVLQNEIRRILIVDPHDICLKLFAKTLRLAFPKIVEITTASSSKEAASYLHNNNNRSFDIAIVEERLGLFHRQDGKEASGSSLLRDISSSHHKTLLIGVSARLPQDGERLQQAGADFLWPKPPPPLTPRLVDEMLQVLLLKRGRTAAVKELFG